MSFGCGNLGVTGMGRLGVETGSSGVGCISKKTRRIFILTHVMSLGIEREYGFGMEIPRSVLVKRTIEYGKWEQGSQRTFLF